MPSVLTFPVASISALFAHVRAGLIGRAVVRALAVEDESALTGRAERCVDDDLDDRGAHLHREAAADHELVTALTEAAGDLESVVERGLVDAGGARLQIGAGLLPDVARQRERRTKNLLVERRDCTPPHSLAFALRTADLMPLAHAVIEPPSGKAEKWMLFLHGILGSGANWRTFARAFVKERPEWGAVLVDLRLHGDSTTGFAPPHTVAAAAADVHELFAVVPGPVHGVLAHSFGGKVSLALNDLVHGDLDHLFVIDATPGARPDGRGSESTRHIVELLSSLPEELGSRDEFMKLVEERGVTRPTAMWLAMNVRPVPNTTKFVFRIDVAAVKQMLADYFAIDLWPIVEKDEGRVQKHLVVGGKSSVVDEADRERWRKAPRATVDVIEEAGHWVHADAPDALRRIVVRHMSGESD